MSDRITFYYSTPPADVAAWLAARGYWTLAALPVPGIPAGIMFCKPGGQVRMARVGDTLVHNGTTVKVESA